MKEKHTKHTWRGAAGGSRVRAVLAGVATGVVMGLALFLIWKAVFKREPLTIGQREKSLPAATPSRRAEPGSRGTQVARLRAWLMVHPSQAIPEMRLVSPDTWAQVCAAIDFDSPESIMKAVRSLRGQGRQAFGAQLATALVDYADENEGALPDSLDGLRPFLGPECGEAMLRRYALLAHGDYGLLAEETPIVGEIAGVDDEYDSVLSVSKRLLTRLNADRSGAEIQRAIHRYVQANQGKTPPTAYALASFLTIPIADSDIHKYFNKGGIEISVKN